MIKLYLTRMIDNNHNLAEFNNLNDKNFNTPLNSYDLKHNLLNKRFKILNELNKAIEEFKNKK